MNKYLLTFLSSLIIFNLQSSEVSKNKDSKENTDTRERSASIGTSGEIQSPAERRSSLNALKDMCAAHIKLQKDRQARAIEKQKNQNKEKEEN